MKSHKTSKRRTLSFQPLEDRSLMAGNVTAAVQNHALVINGDNQGNAIEIQQVGDGQFKIFAIDGSTKINDQTTAQTFSGVTGDFKINLKGGSDTLSIDNAAHAVPVMTLPGNLNVDLGSGDFDFVALTNASVRGSVSITAEAEAKISISVIRTLAIRHSTRGKTTCGQSQRQQHCGYDLCDRGAGPDGEVES